MLTAPIFIDHPAVGEQKISKLCRGFLPESCELKLRDFFSTLEGDIAASPYGHNREAWLIGEPGTSGDYDFAKFKFKLNIYDSWIFELGRKTDREPEASGVHTTLPKWQLMWSASR
jgi:hypothetical protein